MDNVKEFLANIGLPLENLIQFGIMFLVFIVALFISKYIAGFVGKGIKKASFIKTAFDKIGINLNLEKIGNVISKIVYFLLIFAIFIGVLESNYINIDTSKLPLIGDLKGLVKSLLEAGVVALIAWFLASIAKISIIKSFKSSDLEKKLSENIKTSGNISETVGVIAYWLIILFFLPKVLKSLQLNDIANQITGILNSFVGYIDDLFAAALIIAIFYIVGKVVAKLISEFLSNVGFDKVLGLIGLKNIESTTTPSFMVGKLAFAYILLIAITEAAKALQLENISLMVNEIIAFSVNIILGIIILAIGMYLGNLASNAVKTTSNSKFLALLAKVGIIILTFFMALQQMQIGGEIVNQAFTLLLGSIAVAFALAVGLGSKEVAGEEVKKLIEKMKK